MEKKHKKTGNNLKQVFQSKSPNRITNVSNVSDILSIGETIILRKNWCLTFAKRG